MNERMKDGEIELLCHVSLSHQGLFSPSLSLYLFRLFRVTSFLFARQKMKKEKGKTNDEENPEKKDKEESRARKMFFMLA
jgi:hypothetical protein